MELIESSFRSREERLREENRLLSSESMDKLRALERDRTELISSYAAKQQQLEETKRQEVDAMRAQHRQALEDMRHEHDDVIERLKRAKDQEIEAVISRHSHSKYSHQLTASLLLHSMSTFCAVQDDAPRDGASGRQRARAGDAPASRGSFSLELTHRPRAQRI